MLFAKNPIWVFKKNLDKKFKYQKQNPYKSFHILQTKKTYSSGPNNSVVLNKCVGLIFCSHFLGENECFSYEVKNTCCLDYFVWINRRVDTLIRATWISIFCPQWYIKHKSTALLSPLYIFAYERSYSYFFDKRIIFKLGLTWSVTCPMFCSTL